MSQTVIERFEEAHEKFQDEQSEKFIARIKELAAAYNKDNPSRPFLMLAQGHYDYFYSHSNFDTEVLTELITEGGITFSDEAKGSDYEEELDAPDELVEIKEILDVIDEYNLPHVEIIFDEQYTREQIFEMAKSEYTPKFAWEK